MCLKYYFVKIKHLMRITKSVLAKSKPITRWIWFSWIRFHLHFSFIKLCLIFKCSESRLDLRWRLKYHQSWEVKRRFHSWSYDFRIHLQITSQPNLELWNENGVWVSAMVICTSLLITKPRDLPQGPEHPYIESSKSNLTPP